MQSKIDIDLLRARIAGAKQACEKKRETHMRTAIYEQLTVYSF